MKWLKILALKVVLCWVNIVSAQGYNEMVDESGNLRPAYQWLAEQYPYAFPIPSPEYLAMVSRSPLRDQLSIAPVPLVLSVEEGGYLRAGTKQRAHALLQLFYDLFIGEQKIITERKLFTDDFFQSVIADCGFDLEDLRYLYAEKDLKDISMHYAPDLIRSPDGNWYVMEDNIGNIGGLGDFYLMQYVFEIMRKLEGQARAEFTKNLVHQDPIFQTVWSFLLRLSSDNRQIVFHLRSSDTTQPAYSTAPPRDRESFRLTHLVELSFKTLLSQNGRLRITPQSDIELIQALEDAQTSGYFNLDSSPLDPELRRRELEVFRTRDVSFLRSPMTQVVSHKAFLPFMDEIIRFYTGSEPLLPTAHSQLILHETDLPSDIDNWVFKRTNQDGGHQVYVMAQIFEPYKNQVLKIIKDSMISNNPFQRAQRTPPAPQWIAQRYYPPSILPMGGPQSWAWTNVDVRPMAYINGETIWVNEVPWGRQSSMTSALSNVSQGGYLSVVKIADCRDLTMPL